jgi:hypothetical protein
LCFEQVDTLGAYGIPSETSLLIHLFKSVTTGSTLAVGHAKEQSNPETMTRPNFG